MNDNVINVVCAIFLIGFVGMSLYAGFQRGIVDNLKRQAIELKHAEYNSQTGEWQWITNNYSK